MDGETNHSGIKRPDALENMIDNLQADLNRLRSTLKEKDRLIEGYQKLHEYTIAERRDADAVINAYESVDELTRNEIDQLRKTIQAHESVEELARVELCSLQETIDAHEQVGQLARNEIDDLLKTVDAQERLQDLSRTEILNLRKKLNHKDDGDQHEEKELSRELLDAEKTIHAFENLQEFQRDQFEYYENLIQAYENVGVLFTNEIKQLRQIVRAHEAVEELARKEMLSLQTDRKSDLNDRDMLIDQLNSRLSNSEKTISALDRLMEHQRQTKKDLDKTIKAYRALSSLSREELDSAYRTIRVHEELEKLAWQEKEEVDRDLIRAQKVQQELISGDTPETQLIRYASSYTPSTRLGGDFYGFKKIRKGRLSFLMSDAAGHGSQAALVAAIVKTLFEEYAPVYLSPSHLLSRLNSSLFEILKNIRTFITAVNLTIDPQTLRLTYSNGGHPFVWIRHPDGEIIQLQQTGSLLGAFREVSFHTKSIQLNPGDLIFVFTDGIPESLGKNGAEYGEERLKRLLIDHGHENPPDLINRVRESVFSHHGSSRLEDDVSVVAMRIGD